jgi:hypothetical protein
MTPSRVGVFLCALLPSLLCAQRGNVVIPVFHAVTIPLNGRLCADTIIVYGTLECVDYSCICAGAVVRCYGRCIPPGLPVELLSFSAVETRGVVRLHWITTSEFNNYGFELQRRRDAGCWFPVTFVKGNGTTAEQHDYACDDAVADVVEVTTVLSYRLKQIDYDGKETFSPVVDLRRGSAPGSPRLHAVYPNPARSELVVPVTLAGEQPVRMTIYDAMGRRVLDLLREEPRGSGYHAFRVDVSHLESGTYLVEIAAGSERRTQVVTVRE